MRDLATEIEVRVLNVGNAKGSMGVAVYTAETWLSKSWSYAARVPAEAGVMSIVIPGVEPGVYGVVAHHDANDDGEINRDMFGRPKEGIGFSREAPLLFGPPRFKDAAVQVGEERLALDITLAFEPKK